jgi:CubicO group peptidase (beta-lactamase class C family)
MPENAILILVLTKQFTAAAILKLVEAKKLSLDDDFTTYLKFDTKGRKSPLLNYLTTPLGWKLIWAKR